MWINGVKYISPSTFGKPCPLEEELEDAKRASAKDKDLKKLLEDLSMKSEFHIPILPLDVVIEDNEVVDVKVKGGKAKILTCGPMLMKRINKVVTSRRYQNGEPEGITHREKGFNLILSKTGEKLDTEYDAEGDVQWEMDEKYYEDYPNVYEEAKDEMKSDEYLRGVIRNYLYGEEMPEEETDDTDEEKEEKPSRSRRSSKSEDEKPSRGRSRRAAKDEDEEEEKPSRTRRSSKSEDDEEEEKPKKKSGGKRDLLSDLDGLD
jgi:hypothetical protein